jgi:hypothetical protein
MHVAVKEESFPENVVRLERWPWPARGAVAGAGSRAQRGRGRCFRRALLYLETGLLLVFPTYKAEQLLKRHLETARVRSFRVTDF